MPRTYLLSYLAWVSILSGHQAWSELPRLPPTTLEIDLAFPRNGATHRRAYPFPIIFAVQGAKNVWPYHLRLSYTVYDTDLDEADPGAAGTHSTGEIGEDTPSLPNSYTSGEVPDGDDPYFSIGWTSLMLNSTSTDFYVEWKAMMPANCSANDDIATAKGSFLEGAAPRYSGDPFIAGKTHFKVSDDAPMDIAWPNDTCPDAAAMLIEGPRGSPTNTLRIGGTVTDAKCIFFDEENLRPEPNSCAAKADSAVAARATQKFLDMMGCEPDDAWPADSQGHCFELPGRCPPGRCLDQDPESVGGRPDLTNSLILVVAVGLIVGGFGFWPH